VKKEGTVYYATYLMGEKNRKKEKKQKRKKNKTKEISQGKNS